MWHNSLKNFFQVIQLQVLIQPEDLGKSQYEFGQLGDVIVEKKFLKQSVWLVLAVVLSNWLKYWATIHCNNKLGKFQGRVTRTLRIQAVLGSYNETSSKELENKIVLWGLNNNNNNIKIHVYKWN